LCLIYLICSLHEQLAPTMGYEVILYGPTRILSKMVSTYNRAGVNKQAEVGSITPATTSLDLTAVNTQFRPGE